MKRRMLAILLCLAALPLAACGRGSADATAQGDGPAATEASPAALPADGEAASQPAEQNAAAAQPEAVEKASVRAIDLDLTALSGTVVYSQVYDMVMEPDAYTGQTVKMRGNLNYFQAPDTKQEYFAAVIADATACCAQGIEFVWKGEHAWPRDYPPLDTEVTVTGTFGTYDENGYTYIQLTDADVSW